LRAGESLRETSPVAGAATITGAKESPGDSATTSSRVPASTLTGILNPPFASVVPEPRGIRSSPLFVPCLGGVGEVTNSKTETEAPDKGQIKGTLPFSYGEIIGLDVRLVTFQR
jgi:hypothetical protein